MGKVKVNEEVIEMKQDESGMYNASALVKVNSEDQLLFEPTPPTKQNMPIFHEILGGFVIGLGAIERLMLAIEKSKKKEKR